MKRIILLRHAKTEPYDYHKDDFKRNLTVRGVSDSHLITHELKKKGYSIDKIISSAANRTKQTSELFAEDFGIAQELIVYKKEIYEGVTTQDFLNLLSKTEEEIETVLFVGHNPDIARLAYRLTTSFEHYVPTCCAIVLEAEIEKWQELGNQELTFKDIFIPKFYKN